MASEEYKRMEKNRHTIILEGRERLNISGVIDVLNFDESEIVMETSEGMLTAAGADLHVEKLSLDIGELVITGNIDTLEYSEQGGKKGSFWSKLF